MKCNEKWNEMQWTIMKRNKKCNENVMKSVMKRIGMHWNVMKNDMKCNEM